MKFTKKRQKKELKRKVATGEFDAMVIFDINFEKQQILKLPNLQKIFYSRGSRGGKSHRK